VGGAGLGCLGGQERVCGGLWAVRSEIDMGL
jgi:hypothetical protein